VSFVNAVPLSFARSRALSQADTCIHKHRHRHQRHTHTHALTLAGTDMGARKSSLAYAHICTHTYAHTLTHTHTHTHIHTQTQPHTHTRTVCVYIDMKHNSVGVQKIFR